MLVGITLVTGVLVRSGNRVNRRLAFLHRDLSKANKSEEPSFRFGLGWQEHKALLAQRLGRPHFQGTTGPVSLRIEIPFCACSPHLRFDIADPQALLLREATRLLKQNDQKDSRVFAKMCAGLGQLPEPVTNPDAGKVTMPNLEEE